MNLTKMRRICYAVINLVLDLIEEHINVIIMAFAIISCLWFINECSYRTLVVRDVDYTTDEVVVEYKDNLYAAFVDHDLLDDYEEQGYALVQMKSICYWDFEVCPELDEILNIRL